VYSLPWQRNQYRVGTVSGEVVRGIPIKLLKQIQWLAFRELFALHLVTPPKLAPGWISHKEIGAPANGIVES
jgi:hypothetical protein